MMPRHSLLISVFAVSCLAAIALAGELGDQAAPLKIEKWVKGGPVDLAAGRGKTVYVVEFWATWCAPCRETIPHLTDLQKKYRDKGVVFVGVSIDEDRKRKTRDKVEPFVRDMGERMDYAVALDTPDIDTGKAYMDAYTVLGIPATFVVDKEGRVAWVGGPAGVEKVLDEMLAGKYDLKAARAADKERQAAAQRQQRVFELMGKYFEMVSQEEKSEEAENFGWFTLMACKGDAMLLNDFAWTLLTDEGIKHRDMKLAMKVAQAAYDACEGKDAAIVDTYARALFDSGKKAEAIEYQKKAIELAKSDMMRQELEKTLRDYEKSAG